MNHPQWLPIIWFCSIFLILLLDGFNLYGLIEALFTNLGTSLHKLQFAVKTAQTISVKQLLVQEQPNVGQLINCDKSKQHRLINLQIILDNLDWAFLNWNWRTGKAAIDCLIHHEYIDPTSQLIFRRIYTGRYRCLPMKGWANAC